VFISLSTGYRKSLCYILLQSLFDQIHNVKQKSIVLVISLLLELMEKQVAVIPSLGISSEYVSDAKLN